MGALRVMTIAVLATGLSVATGHAAEGRYSGSYFYTSGTDEGNSLRHLLDLGTRTTLQYGLDLNLKLSLNYRSNPGESQTDLLRSRIYGDLRKGSALRFTGDYMPWQDTSPGVLSPRSQSLQLGIEATPRKAPGFRLTWTRRDRETFEGMKSYVQEGQARVHYATGPVGGALSFRTIENNPGVDEAFVSKTDEWRANLNANQSWSGVSLSSSYEGLYSRYTRLERDRKFYTNRVNANATLRPFRFLTLGANSLVRLGKTEDNSQSGIEDIDERAVSGRLEVRPITGLSVSTVREYRTRKSAGSGPIADYWQLHAKYRRDLIRYVFMQVGGSQTRDLSSNLGSAPTNSAYGILDGKVRKGIFLRSELRVSQDARIDSSSGRWQSLIQLRTIPNKTSRIEINWQESKGAEIAGVAQRSHSWEFILGYKPMPNTDFTGSWRTLKGEGRLNNKDDFASALFSWRTTDTSRLSSNWSRRISHMRGYVSRETSAGVDFTFWPVADWRSKLTWSRVSGDIRTAQTVYGASIETRF